jgi:hypothetical protein
MAQKKKIRNNTLCSDHEYYLTKQTNIIVCHTINSLYSKATRPANLHSIYIMSYDNKHEGGI